MPFFHTSYEPPQLLQTLLDFTKPMPWVPALLWLEQGELRWVWEDGGAPAQPSRAVPKIQGQTRCCESCTQSQALDALAEQAQLYLQAPWIPAWFPSHCNLRKYSHLFALVWSSFVFRFNNLSKKYLVLTFVQPKSLKCKNVFFQFNK